jgi:hypothetical protein
MVPPPQVPVKPFGVETVNPAGKGSEKPTPVSAIEVFGLVTLKLRLVLPPTAIDIAPKLLVMEGGFATVRLAVEVLPLPPLVDETVTELLFVPGAVPVTFTEKVQLAEAVSVAPDKVTDPDPPVAVIVPPPQVPVKPLGVETAIPAGKVSVKATPVSAIDVFGLVTVKLRLVLPPTAIDAAPKLLVMDGGEPGAEPTAFAGQNPASLSVTRTPVLTSYVQ